MVERFAREGREGLGAGRPLDKKEVGTEWGLDLDWELTGYSVDVEEVGGGEDAWMLVGGEGAGVLVVWDEGSVSEETVGVTVANLGFHKEGVPFEFSKPRPLL